MEEQELGSVGRTFDRPVMAGSGVGELDQSSAIGGATSVEPDRC